MKKVFFSIAITIFSFSIGATQTAQGDIEIYMENLIDNMPGSTGSDYELPTNNDLNTWDVVIGFILVNDLQNARTNADLVNYQITEFTDTTITPNQTFYVLEEKSPQLNYWGTYVFNPSPERGTLILQAPHAEHDTNTGIEAVFCFKNNLARAVFVNGTHRCNHSTLSSCSGKTEACGSKSDFKISDLAHHTGSIFQKTTENIFLNEPGSVFIQLHGFSKKSTDPYVIMSNGTRETPPTDYASQIKDALLIEDNSLTFKLGHIDLSWDRLLGFTNTQGRFINQSPDPCATSAVNTTGRFIHVEQEKSKLRADIAGWTKMSNALASVFPITSGPDSDGDGVSDALDQCPGLDDSLIGTPCDDGDICTINDVYDNNCQCAGVYTDVDNDSFCIGEDPNDTNACIPDQNHENCVPCSDIIFDSFESGYGNWNDGGSDAARVMSNAYTGDYSVRLRDNSSSSMITTDDLDLTNYNEITIDFTYYPLSMESEEDFFLEVSTNGGGSYSIYKAWARGTDFENSVRYFESVVIDDIAFTNTTRFRFRCDASSNEDKVYFDDIEVTACFVNMQAKQAGVEFNKIAVEQSNPEIKVYPNPAKDVLYVDYTAFNQVGAQIMLYDITGKVVKSLELHEAYNHKQSLDLRDIESGLYIIVVMSSKGERISSKRVIVE